MTDVIADAAPQSLAGSGNDMNPMQIVERSSIPHIHSVKIAGERHELGVVKDFRKHMALADFIPEAPERISFSWVRLLPGETLDVHTHPTKTFIIVSEGKGYCTGDMTGTLQAGSIVTVAPNRLHGFCGAGDHGFWALSIQFEGKGLYANPDSARVTFTPGGQDKANLTHLMKAQEYFLEDYKSNALFSVIREHDFHTKYKEPLLDAIQHWSHAFQRILETRLTNADNSLEYVLASEHREEEREHDVKMATLRGNPDIGNISTITQEVADWFCLQMENCSAAEKIILMHFVLEGSADFAHNEIYPFVANDPVSEHFHLHAEEDENHVQMGIDALANLENPDYGKLLSTLMTGWVMMNRVCTEMSDAARRNATFN